MVNIGFLYMSPPPPQMITTEKKICQLPWIMNCLLLDGFFVLQLQVIFTSYTVFWIHLQLLQSKMWHKNILQYCRGCQQAVNRCELEWTSPSNLSRTQNYQWSDWDILDFNIYFHNSVNMFNIGYRLCSAFAALPTAGPAKMNYRMISVTINIILFQQTTNSGHHTW